MAAGGMAGEAAAYLGCIDLLPAMLARVALVIVGLVLLFCSLDAALRRLVRSGIDTGFELASVWLGLMLGAAVVADWLPLAESRDISQTLTTPTLLRPAGRPGPGRRSRTRAGRSVSVLARRSRM